MTLALMITGNVLVTSAIGDRPSATMARPLQNEAMPVVMSATASSPELAKTSDLSQELRIGVGEATASVRTLSAVSLTVHARELVVLCGSRGAGERALLAVLAGDRRGVTGSCTIGAHVRVRLMRISSPAALALAQEWQKADALYAVGNGAMGTSGLQPAQSVPDAQHSHATAVELFLLDVVPAPASENPRAATSSGHGSRAAESPAGTPRPWNESNRPALSSWATYCRRRGGAVVMAAGESLGRELLESALARAANPWARTATVREASISPPSVRVVAMHCGRLAAPVRLTSRDLSA